MTTPTGTRSPSELGERIQGFIKQMADHGITLQRQPTGAYHLYLEEGGERYLVARAQSARAIESLVLGWETRGWPTTHDVIISREEEPDNQSGPSRKNVLPGWGEKYSDRLVYEGQSQLEGDRSLREMVYTALRDGKRMTFQEVVESLLEKFPNSIFNYRSISATLANFATEGLVKKAGRGEYRKVQGASVDFSGQPTETTSTAPTASPTASDIVDLSSSWANLASAVGNWRMVGISSTGEEIYATPDGEVFAVTVNIRQV